MMIEEGKRSDNELPESSAEDDINIEPSRPLTQSQANKLKNEALTFKRYWEDYIETLATDNSDTLYLLSKRWLTRWKKYVSYEEIIADRQPTRFFGGPVPDKVNDDLIDRTVEACFKYSPLKEHPWNIYTKEGLQERRDYEVVNKKISDFFTNIYEGKPIARTVMGEGPERLAEVNLLRFKAILLYPGIVANIGGGYSTRNNTQADEYLQVGRSMVVSEYIALLERTLPTFRGNFQRDKGVRIWRAPASEDPAKALIAVIKRQTMDLEYHEDQVFDFEGELIDPVKYGTIEEAGLSPTDLVIVEFKESTKPWAIKNPCVAAEGKCEGCYNVKVLDYPCVCKKVSYCSERCKINDEKYHAAKCEKQASDDETVKELIESPNSVLGVCGLSNLGNTCFMNSGLQCLSNTMVLTDYFLSNRFFSEINEDNPLGTKGVLVRKYGSLIKKLWFGNKSTISPSALKMAVGKFQPMFKGYHQHDSSELITFLLDGLHEDLNLIKKKPYVEQTDSEGRQDFDVAKESWQGFTQRNLSVIVDTMYGQYKSKLQCPVCSRISITFDPFLMVSLTVPSTKKKYLSYSVQRNLVSSEKKMELFAKGSTQTVGDFLKKQQEELFSGRECIMFIMSTYQSYEYMSPTKLMAEVRKKSKRVGLGVRELNALELQVPEDQRIFIPISNKALESYGYKRSMYQNNLVVLSRDLTLKATHHALFQLIGFLFKQKLGDQPLDAEFYESKVKDKYFSIELKSNGSFWQNCAYCGKKNCNDCKLPYTDDILGEFVERAEKSDNTLRFEVIFIWTQSPFDKVKIPDIFEHYSKQFLMNEENDTKSDSGTKINKDSGASSVSLYDCLEHSQQPEQLEADNTWYCRDCKEHVRAYKSMQLYKTPKILMFHLKRFKASNRMFKQKLETLVDFPLNGLDLTNYLINSSTPQHYATETPEQNGEVKEGEEAKRVIYDLYAVSNHFGGLGGGHYTAFAKNARNNQWYNFDDSQVNPVTSTDQIVGKAAYVLFYKLREQQDEKNFNVLDS